MPARVFMTYRPYQAQGYTLLEILVVVAIIGLLAGIAMPNYVHARKVSQTVICIDNLREIDTAKRQWALELEKTDADTPTSADLLPYIGRGQPGVLSATHCPLVPPATLGGYTLNPMSAPPKCNQENSKLHPAFLN